MNLTLQNIRSGLRQVRRAPGFAVIAVLTLGVGIGAVTAIFSIVDAVLMKPLVMHDPDRVVLVQEHWREIFPGLSVGNFADLQQQAASFAVLSASNNASFNLSPEGTPERVDGETATGNFFATFDIRPIAGRFFTSEEDRPGHSRVAVISKRLWRRRFQANPTIVGQPLRMNGVPYTVIGIMPKAFDPLLDNSEVWVPEAFTAQQFTNRDDHYLNVIGRLKPGAQIGTAQSQLDVIAQSLQQQYPIDNKERGFRLLPQATALLGDQQLTLRMLLTAVAFLLLIACANIANLQLARARVRQKDIALRSALGASSRRIFYQLLVENAVLGMIGGAVGILLGECGVWAIVAHGPADVPRLAQSTVNGTALGFACAITLLSIVLFGLAPALRSAATQPSEALKEASSTFAGTRDRIRGALVIGEIALALMLLSGAGLLIRSAIIVAHLDPGFDTGNLVVGRVGLPDAAYRDPAVAQHTFERMIEAAAAIPGVQSAAVVSRAPLAEGSSINGILPEGNPLDASNLVNALLQIVSPSYIFTARVPLKIGRDFTPADTRGTTLVTVVNEKLAHALWPGENPIGKRFACCEQGPKGHMDPVWHEVVGVVGDVRATGLDQQVQPQFYLPLAQMPPNAWDWLGRTMDLMVRTRNSMVPANDLRTAVSSVAPGVPIYQLSTVPEKLAATLERSHFDTFLLALFGAIAMLLSSVGIYGVLSYLVAQRTRDIGLRIALGATHSRVARDVLSHGLRLIGFGVALGLASALACARLIASLLYGIRATDTLTFTVASAALAAVALVASYIPARRAMQVDPMVALRYE